MDRKDWLTLVYREANLFLERHGKDAAKPEDLEDLEPELHAQVQEVLATCAHLEDIVKHSLLKNPPPDLWYGENHWSRVLISVACACLMHDVMGVAEKIIAGELPRVPASSIHQAVDPEAPRPGA